MLSGEGEGCTTGEGESAAGAAGRIGYRPSREIPRLLGPRRA